MSKIVFDPMSETRYDRHHLISWWDQERLNKTNVIVVGAGALGNEVLKLLALIGIGRILVIDFDKISLSNLSRTVLFRESDVGASKAAVAAKRVKEINPEIEVEYIEGDLRTDIGLGKFRSADLVFGCLDSVNARWALNRKCMMAGVEWIDGGISDFHGSVARYSPEQGACYECNFTEQTYHRFNQRYSCPFGLISTVEEPKVPTTAVTTSVIAAFQVQQALFILHNLDDGLSPGERLMIYLKPFALIKDKLPFNPSCLAHGRTVREVVKLQYNNETTFSQLLGDAGVSLAQIQQIKLPFEVVTRFICDSCQSAEEVMLPREKVYQHQATCPKCHQMRSPEILDIIQPSAKYMNFPIRRFCIPADEIIEVVESDRSIFFQLEF